ncbi:Signal transduction histidine kinase [Austwickia chelonae]|uniref:sensor histidine kinase n=1 Tax=Austwickia chelonae TaxID=100225 RepID=UPI00031880B2|nr:PAS domain-containing sensor histidine kinase [Austwickia chelonae]SEW40923.1 Signal transduction histidine kinase [Austwickia chelonae]
MVQRAKSARLREDIPVRGVRRRTTLDDISPRAVMPVARNTVRPGVATTARIVASLLAGAGGLGLVRESTGLSSWWILQGIFFVEAACAWDAAGLRSRTLWTRYLQISIGFLLGAWTCFALGWAPPLGPLELARIVLANAAGALVAAGLYRFRGLGESWFPRDVGESLWLMISVSLAPAVTLVLGGFPHEDSTPAFISEADIWAYSRGFAFLAVAANCVLPLYFRGRPSLLTPLPLRWWPFFVAGTAFALASPYLWPQQPLSWQYLVPLAVAGALMTPMYVIGVTLAVATLVALLPYPPVGSAPLFGVVRPEASLDLLLGFASNVSMLIVVFRIGESALSLATARHSDAERSQREVSDAILESMSDGLLITGEHGVVVRSNAALTQLLGQEPPRRITLEWARRVRLQAADRDRELDVRDYARLLRPVPGTMRRTPLTITDEQGAVRRLAVSTQDLVMRGAPFTLWLFRDVTARDEHQRELESFAGTVARDLKGPLGALTGWMQTADADLADADADAGRQALERAHAAVAQMRALIDDYLAYTVSHSGELVLTGVSIAEMTQEIASIYTSDTHRAHFDIDAPHPVHADAALTRQLLSNLVSNSVKFVRDGHDPIIRVESRPSGPDMVEISVADQGIGLNRAGRELLSDGTGLSGTGLGLALCRAIVTRHGGRIVAEDNEWGGTTMVFTLPAAPVSQLRMSVTPS